MPIDTSIYGRIQQPKIDSPFEAQAKAYQFRELQQKNKLADMLFADKEREATERNALTGILSDRTNYDERGNLRRDALPKIGSVAPGQYRDYQKHLTEQEKAVREAEKERIASAKTQMELIGQVAGAAKDPQSYARGLQMLGQAGIDVSQIPQEYDPAYVEQARAQAMTAAQQLEQMWKQKGYELDVSKFGYQQRNDAANRNVTVRGQNLTDARGRESNEIARQKNAPAGGKPLPPAALKLRVESQEMADIADGINERLSGVLGRIDGGKLSFGPVKNLTSEALNLAGMSTENSRNYASFKAELEKLRNDSLRLNTGVQTDGDAQRAWNEVLKNINDTELVKQRLAEVMQLNERAKALRLMEVDTINRNYGAVSDAATPGVRNSQNSPNLPMPKSKAELVSGNVYETPRGPARWDGNQFVMD